MLPIKTGMRPSWPATVPETEPFVSSVLPMVKLVTVRLVIAAEGLRMVPENPFSEFTGPVKVVDASANYLMHKSPTCLCIVR